MLTGDVPFRTNEDICGGDISFTWVATFCRTITNYKLQITNYKRWDEEWKRAKFSFSISLLTLSASFKSCDEFFLDVLCLDRNLRKLFEIMYVFSQYSYEQGHPLWSCASNAGLPLSKSKHETYSFWGEKTLLIVVGPNSPVWLFQVARQPWVDRIVWNKQPF